MKDEADQSGEIAATRCGFVALIGAPNCGKSTLVNALVGEKVTIVTPKVQTTRTLVRGVAMAGEAQLVLIDTPGVFAPKRRLERAMVDTAWGGARDADIVCTLIDAERGVDARAQALLGKLPGLARPCALVINKIDLVQKPVLLEIAQAAAGVAAFAATFMLCARDGNGVADLRQWLAAQAPPGPWHYPPDRVSDAPLRSLAAEITREKLFLRLHQELPYQSTVETEAWIERKDGSVRVEQTIYVERESQRSIVLGKGGQTIKSIGAQARIELEKLLGHRVHLFLFVKVRAGWADDPERYRAMGLEFPRR
ncbi:MAG: GTPase Era [Proteobacteria bacterium]|nr:GTPase Era [Pseudomonadota bacterium]